jgi:hypothetical protein
LDWGQLQHHQLKTAAAAAAAAKAAKAAKAVEAAAEATVAAAKAAAPVAAAAAAAVAAVASATAKAVIAPVILAVEVSSRGCYNSWGSSITDTENYQDLQQNFLDVQESYRT